MRSNGKTQCAANKDGERGRGGHLGSDRRKHREEQDDSGRQKVDVLGVRGQRRGGQNQGRLG